MSDETRRIPVFLIAGVLAWVFFMAILAAIVHRVDLGVLWGWM